VVRAPGLFQIDSALTKHVAIRKQMGMEFGVEAFNILNHPQLGAPGVNIGSALNFGRITSPVNPSPVGAGTPRQIQFVARFSF
jgi:hypothetical protein